MNYTRSNYNPSKSTGTYLGSDLRSWLKTPPPLEIHPPPIEPDIANFRCIFWKQTSGPMAFTGSLLKAEEGGFRVTDCSSCRRHHRWRSISNPFETHQLPIS
ncbi:hypothetical protein L2E82_48992 [Cichorium intybus]|nr:hypothetical protein L2E82_48992 [Cichorium intybus]